MLESVKRRLLISAATLGLLSVALLFATPPLPVAPPPTEIDLVSPEIIGILSEPQKHARSTHWPVIRKAHLEKESVCRGCGSKHDLQVHHLKPFHLYPELELEDSNLATVCRMCHFVICHLNGWSRENQNADRDLKAHHKEVEAATK